MNRELLAYIYAFSSVLTFATSAVGFTYFSQKVSPLWMNVFKCVVAFTVSIVVMSAFGYSLWQPIEKVWPFLLSGFIGLNIGDFFLLSSYKRIGPARTLVLFGFEPLMVGSFAYIFWDEKLYSMQSIAIIFFVLCLILFSYEQFKKTGHWELKGLGFALLGVLLDSVGVILTRYAYNENPEFEGLEALYFRAFGAFISFSFFLPFVKVDFVSHLKKLSHREKGVAVLASFLGTFLSLMFYMQAIRIGKLAMVTSIILTDPMVSTFFECLWLRVWPSRYLWFAIASFACAMFFLMYPQIS